MGDIIQINCNSCNNNEDFFIGMGMLGRSTNLYHCPNCNFLDVSTDEDIRDLLNRSIKDSKNKYNFDKKNFYCSICKSSKKISVMNIIEEKDVPKCQCYKCGEKKLEVFSVGNWD